MMESGLPSPGIGGKGHHLRRIAAQAISYIQVNAPAFANGKHPQADELTTFFNACSAALSGYVMATPVTQDID